MTDFADGGPLIQRCRIAPAATFGDHPDDYPWQDITPDLRWTEPLAVTVGSEDEQPEAFSEMVLALRNGPSRVEGDAYGMVGRYTTDNANSDLWPDFEQNVPIEHAISVDNGATYDVTARMYLTASVDDVGKTDKMPITRITANGLFTRMGQWDDLESAAYRAMIGVRPGDLVPYSYWSMEDGKLATSFANAMPGRSPGLFKHILSITDPADVAPGDLTAPPGSKSLAKFGRGAAAQLIVDPYADGGHWAVQGAAYAGDDSSLWFATYRLVSGYRLDVVIDLTAGAGQLILNALDPAGSIVDQAISSMDETQIAGDFASIVVDAVDLGAGSDRASVQILGIDGIPIASADLLDPGIYSMIKTIDLGSYGAGDADAGFGHWGVFIDLPSDTSPDGTDNAKGLGGFVGESPSARAERVCAELGIPFEAFGDDSGEAFVMGPQTEGKALAVLRECEKTGRAIMTDHLGLVQYYCLSEAYNQDPIYTIDGSTRTLFLPYSPTTDDLGRANRVTASQPGGSSATYEDVDDQLGIPGVRPARGVYKGATDANVADPAMLFHHAAFEVARGTVPGRRVPQVTLDALRVPAQGVAMLTAKPRSLLRVVAPPAQFSRNPVDLVIKGWTMVVYGPRRGWKWSCNTTRADPYAVGVYGPASVVSRYDLVNATLGAPITLGTSTSMSIVTTGELGELLAVGNTAPTFPFDVNICGAQVRVTQVAGAASPQTATIEADTINEVEKIAPSGSRITLWKPSRYGL